MHSLKPTGLPLGQRAQARDEMHHFDRSCEGRVARGRNAVHADRHAACRGNFRRHLGARQHATVTRLGALGELDLDHLDLRRGRLRGEPLVAKRTVVVATAEIAAAELPDQVPAEFAVISADATLAGVVCEVSELGALVERANGVRAQRAEAHGGNVEERQRVGLPTLGAADFQAEIMTINRKGSDGMIDPFEIVAVDILLSAERAFVEGPLRALIGDRALGAVERRSVGVALQKVLADLRSDLFQAEADIGEDRIVPPQAVLGLQNIPDADRAHHGAEGEEDNE